MPRKHFLLNWKSTVNSFKGERKPDLDDIDDLKLTAIIEVEGNVIVCKDTEHSESSISNTSNDIAGLNLKTPKI